MPPVEHEGLWSLVVPVKRLERAKSRLSGAVGLPRADLALAVACDTVLAAAAAERVGDVFVVTEDGRASAALAELGARIVGGEPGTGLNPALEHGAAAAQRAQPGRARAALSADLPALRPGELDSVLAQATALLARAHGGTAAEPAPEPSPGYGRPPQAARGARGDRREGERAAGAAFLADAPGIGTTLYAVPSGARFAPAFEGGSRHRHLAGGAAELDGSAAPSVRRDVDTPGDLRQAARLGVGPHTAKLLADAGW